MAKGDSGLTYPNVFNETGTGGPESPDVNGDKLYVSYDEVISNHLKQADIFESTNSKASHDVYGGPAKGEPNPGGQGGQGGK